MIEPNHSLRTIFAAAIEIAGPQERAEYLSQACGGDVALRREIEELIQAEAAMGGFLPDQPGSRAAGEVLLGASQAPGSKAGPSPAPVMEKTGDRIGRYKLLQQIGEGGCGIVYLAEQEEPVRRKVALKVIKLGMDTKQVVARFEAERQALALMDHPNIARVLDAGATETGRPFFVMELVRGIRITEYCDQNQFDTRGRLELFIRVCQAVQHAHQKGIIHRDLKPSNILVTVNDGVPVPKVIDFGIAKATEGRLTDQTVFTAFEQFLGTPAYMSPEQAAMTSLDIDTRSDIYSLGVLLYELLTGTTPFDTKALLAAGLDEMRRTIREKEPARPSVRLTTLAAGVLASRANHRGVEPSKLIHLLRGDLDWIVMKCLEKDRNRRYATANALASDVTRYLNREPVLARPAGSLYRLQKLVDRHRLALAAGAVLAAVVALSLAFALYETSHGRRIATQSLVRLHVANGTRMMNDGDLLGSLLSFSEALRLDEGSPDREASHRIRIAAVLRQCPTLVGVFCHAGPISGAVFSRDDRRLITVSEDRTARVWDVASGRLLLELNHDGPVYGVTLSPDGNLMLTVSSKPQPCFWQTATGERVLRPSIRHRGQWRRPQPCFSPDGSRLLTLPEFNTAQVWDVASGQACGQPLHHDGEIGAFSFSPDGRLVASIGDDHSARVWDAFTGELRWNFLHEEPVSDATFSPNGRWLVTGSDDGQVRFWDLSSGRLLPPSLEHPHGVEAVSFNLEGDRLVARSWDKSVQVWDVSTRQPLIGPIQHDLEVFQATFSPDGRRVVTTEGGNVLRICDAETGELVVPILSHGLWRDPAVFSSDGRLVVTVHREEARVWDVGTLEAPRLAIRPVAFFKESSISPNGRFKARIGGDNTVRALDLGSGEPLGQPIHQSDPIKQVIFGADSDLLITEGADTRGRIWDLATGEPLVPPVGTRYALDAPLVSRRDLPREDLPVPDVASLARLLSASRMDDSGRLRPLDASEARELWSRLTNRYPARFGLSSSSRTALAWHKQEATASEQAWNWRSAIFHLDCLLAASPGDPALRARRAYAEIALKHSLQIAADRHMQPARVIPPRDASADTRLIDLTSHYNVSLKELSPVIPRGLQTLAGVPFDLRGAIQLSGREDPRTGADHPRQVLGIPVGRKCSRLCFLHASRSRARDGASVGMYRLHYGNAETRTVPIVYGADLRSQWTWTGEPLTAQQAETLWAGTSLSAQITSRSLHLFKSTWANPIPDQEIVSLDFISAASDASPFLVAVTAE